MPRPFCSLRVKPFPGLQRSCRVTRSRNVHYVEIVETARHASSLFSPRRCGFISDRETLLAAASSCLCTSFSSSCSSPIDSVREGRSRDESDCGDGRHLNVHPVDRGPASISSTARELGTARHHRADLSLPRARVNARQPTYFFNPSRSLSFLRR